MDLGRTKGEPLPTSSGKKRPLGSSSTELDKDKPQMRKLTPPGPASFANTKLLVTILIPNEAVGLLIGKAGATLKQLNESSGARVAIQHYDDMPPDSKLRGLTIGGTFEQVKTAEAEILDKLRFRRPVVENASNFQIGTGPNGEAITDPDKCIMRWVIPVEQCGLLIGKKGAGIQALNQQSGSWIKVSHEQEMPRGSKERIVYIQGTKETNELARQLIFEKVGGKPYNVDIPLAPTQDTGSILCPIRAVGFILGSGGAGVKKICEDTGARITISSAEELETGSGDTKMTCFGTTESVARAKEILQGKINVWLQQQEAEEDPSDRETSIKMTITAGLIGAIIGKGGASVKEINRSTGAYIKILNTEKSHSLSSDEKPIHLSGKISCIFEAQKALLTKITQAKEDVKHKITRDGGGERGDGHGYSSRRGNTGEDGSGGGPGYQRNVNYSGSAPGGYSHNHNQQPPHGGVYNQQQPSGGGSYPNASQPYPPPFQPGPPQPYNSHREQGYNNRYGSSRGGDRRSNY